jgi:hypothetical protein
MIVNLLQCIVNSGHQHLGEFVKAQALSTFVAIETRHKFRNKGLYYILSLFGKDVEMMVKGKKMKNAKERVLKAKNDKEQRAMDSMANASTSIAEQTHMRKIKGIRDSVYQDSEVSDKLGLPYLKNRKKTQVV